MKRNVVKFDDIEGMLAEDELRGIVGGCAWWNGSSWSGDGSSGGYNGPDLGTVSVGGSGGTGSGNSPGPSGYPNGYPTGGWPTGSGNGYNGGGGAADPTANGPQARLVLFVEDNYRGFLANHPNVVLRTGSVPDGFSLNANGQYVNNSNGEVVYGVTHKSGDLTFVDISPNIMNIVDGAHMNTLIGHELIHAINIEQNSDLYNSNRAQFNLNSELAAYTFQYNIAVNVVAFSGNSPQAQAYQAQADQMLAYINSYIAQGAQGGFSTEVR